MYCPQCCVEYRDGVTGCPVCHVPLVSAPDRPEPSDPALELVVVLETSDQILLAMAKGLLEEAGIPLFVLGQIATLVQEVDGFLLKWFRLQVPRDREAESREILEQLLQPVAEDPAGAEA